MRYSHIFITLSGLLMVIPTTGCSDEGYNDAPSLDSNNITFRVSLTESDRPVSRRAESEPLCADRVVKMCDASGEASIFLLPSVTDFDPAVDVATARSGMVNSQDELYDRFYVSAYKYDDTWDTAHVRLAPNYFESQLALKSGTKYAMSPARYWPQDGKMRFLAHAPVGDSAFTFYPHDDAERGPRVHISIADKVENQNDLIVSYSDEITCDGSSTAASLNFKHALTGIRFTCDKSLPEAMITNITFKGVRYEGDFFYNIRSASQSTTSESSLDGNFNPWEVYDKTFSLDLNYHVTGEDDAQITDGDSTFMMLPQTLPSDATVEITVRHLDASGNLTDQIDVISGSLSGREWPAGKIVTYKLSTSDQILEIEEPATFDYLGNVYDASDGTMLSQNTVKVASYAGNKNIQWKVEYQDDGATAWSDASSWLAVDSSWTWQDESEQNVPFVAKSTYTAIDIDNTLKTATQLGYSTTPYNLSNSTGSSTVENTANCYIVSAPGYYILPLVYGNAIKDSGVNSAAYTSTATGSDILTNFKNHLNASITAPYIADNAGCTPAGAAIVWQDAKDLVKDVQYVSGAFSGKGGLSFYVDPSSIAQGNALVSISDADGNIMWSWHIWVTSFEGFDSTIDLTNQENQTFTIMPVNLGWCSNGSEVRYYPRRQCKVRFTPLTGDAALAQEVTFVQESHTSIPFGNNPYYQWGRKDPFIGTNIAWGNKERWDGSGTYYGTGSENNPARLFSDLVEDTLSNRLTTRECLDLQIRYPDKWHNPPAKTGGSSYVDLNESYANLWGENTFADSKTVYDPCPVGYQVNYFYTYTGFLDSGYDWSSDKGIEFVKATASDWDATNLAEFYTDSTRLHSVTFPVCGYRDWNGKAEVDDFTVRGFVWLRGLIDSHNAYMFRYAAHAAGQANVAPVTEFYSTDGLPVRPALIP